MAQPTNLNSDVLFSQVSNGGINKPGLASSGARHPLDPLTVGELQDAVRILTRDHRLDDQVRFVSINLKEPEKRVVEQYRPGSPFGRQAVAVLLDRGRRTAYEAVVDLDRESTTSFTELPKGIQPSIMLDEFTEVEEMVKRSPEFLEVLRKWGVPDADLVMVEPWSAGIYGTELPDDQGRRRMRALCFLRSEPLDNGYARPMDSMVVVVDLNEMRILRIEEYGPNVAEVEVPSWVYVPRRLGAAHHQLQR